MDLKPHTYPPLPIAHRGFSADYPENTYAAFEAALALPVAGIETDIQLTADAVPVIYHDRTLKLVGGGLKRLRTQDLATLQSLDFGAWMGAAHAHQNLPLLDELLAKYGRATTWLIEIKMRYGPKRARLEQAMRQTLEMIAAHGLSQSCMILCFDLDLLAYGHQLDPRPRYVWNQNRPARFAPEAPWLYAYSLQHRAVSPQLVAQIHAANKPVMTFTVDETHILERVVAAGVDAVMANNPRRLIQQLSLLEGDKGS